MNPQTKSGKLTVSMAGFAGLRTIMLKHEFDA
jgi:hypothetical protein